MLDIEPLDPIKLPLITRLYKQHYPSGKAKRDELIIAGYLEGTLSAVVRFRSIESYRLLTGMLVIPAAQGKGLGHQLLDYCQHQVLQTGDYCFAYQHLHSFYAQHGFVEEPALPGALDNLYRRYTASGKKLVAMRYLGA